MSDSTICSDCNQTLDDLTDLPSGTHAPCPNCGSRRRTIKVSVQDNIVVSDHFAMQGKRKGKTFSFGESHRLDGRAASADRSDGGAFSVSGSSPQGEEQTLNVCRLLVKRLNSLGATWGEPSLIELADVDCQAIDTENHENVLCVQVVQAVTDPQLWQRLSTHMSGK